GQRCGGAEPSPPSLGTVLPVRPGAVAKSPERPLMGARPRATGIAPVAAERGERPFCPLPPEFDADPEPPRPAACPRARRCRTTPVAPRPAAPTRAGGARGRRRG